MKIITKSLCSMDLERGMHLQYYSENKHRAQERIKEKVAKDDKKDPLLVKNNECDAFHFELRIRSAL